jgi:hypothetical protein
LSQQLDLFKYTNHHLIGFGRPLMMGFRHLTGMIRCSMPTQLEGLVHFVDFIQRLDPRYFGCFRLTEFMKHLLTIAQFTSLTVHLIPWFEFIDYWD